MCAKQAAESVPLGDHEKWMSGGGDLAVYEAEEEGEHGRWGGSSNRKGYRTAGGGN